MKSRTFLAKLKELFRSFFVAHVIFRFEKKTHRWKWCQRVGKKIDLKEVLCQPSGASDKDVSIVSKKRRGKKKKNRPRSKVSISILWSRLIFQAFLNAERSAECVIRWWLSWASFFWISFRSDPKMGENSPGKERTPGQFDIVLEEERKFTTFYSTTFSRSTFFPRRLKADKNFFPKRYFSTSAKTDQFEVFWMREKRDIGWMDGETDDG